MPRQALARVTGRGVPSGWGSGPIDASRLVPPACFGAGNGTGDAKEQGDERADEEQREGEDPAAAVDRPTDGEHRPTSRGSCRFIRVGREIVEVANQGVRHLA